MSTSPFLKLYGRLQFLQLLCPGSGDGGVDHSKGGDHSGPVPKPHGDHFSDHINFCVNSDFSDLLYR